MSMLKTFLVMAPVALSAAALSTAATAAPQRLTDAQYIAAARCEVLMSSVSLGRVDTHDIAALLKVQSNARSVEVFDRADLAREQAAQAARHAGAYSKAALVAERDASCAALTSGGTVSAAVTPAGGTRTN